METIVVEVDGSECARAALEYAAREAGTAGSPVARSFALGRSRRSRTRGWFAPALDQPTLDGFRDGAEPSCAKPSQQ